MTHSATTADPETPVNAAPAKPATIREFEAALRGIGYSQREAKKIAASGFRSLSTELDDLGLLADKLNTVADILRK
jgi:hypothetical protein